MAKMLQEYLKIEMKTESNFHDGDLCYTLKMVVKFDDIIVVESEWDCDHKIKY